jgi:hypothetical protein
MDEAEESNYHVNPPQEAPKKEGEPEKFDRRKFFILCRAVGVWTACEMIVVDGGSDNTLWHSAQAMEDSISYAARRKIEGVEPLSPGELSKFFDENLSEYTKGSCINREAWCVLGIGAAVNMGLELYFEKNLQVVGEELVRDAQAYEIRPEILLGGLAWWGEIKIGSLERIVMEKATNVAQPLISGAVSRADSVLSWQGRDSELIRRYLYSQNGRHADLIGKGMTEVRTIGFLDKEAMVYADAVMHDPRRNEKYDENFLDLCSTIYNLEKQIVEERGKSGTVHTQYDTKYLRIAHRLEKFITRRAHEWPLGKNLILSVMNRYQQIAQSELSGWKWNQLNYDQQKFLWWMLLASWDIVEKAKETDINKKIDIYYGDMRVNIPLIVGQLSGEGIIPEFGEHEKWQSGEINWRKRIIESKILEDIAYPLYSSFVDGKTDKIILK